MFSFFTHSPSAFPRFNNRPLPRCRKCIQARNCHPQRTCPSRWRNTAPHNPVLVFPGRASAYLGGTTHCYRGGFHGQKCLPVPSPAGRLVYFLERLNAPVPPTAESRPVGCSARPSTATLSSWAGAKVGSLPLPRTVRFSCPRYLPGNCLSNERPRRVDQIGDRRKCCCKPPGTPSSRVGPSNQRPTEDGSCPD